MYIAVVVGHSILKDGRCTSADGRHMGGCQEYNWCKAFAKQLKAALKKNGHQTDIIICPEKRFDKKEEEKAYKLGIINSSDYDLVIELHLNAGVSTAEGTEVLYTSSKGKKYAQVIQDKLTEVYRDRGVKKRDDLYILTKTKAPAVVLETFFCTNREEYQKAKGTKNRTRLAKLIAAGIEKAGNPIEK